jgi:FtsP/CotA-like multicopper oxidase with cupredoxin domain
VTDQLVPTQAGGGGGGYTFSMRISQRITATVLYHSHSTVQVSTVGSNTG